MGSLHSGGFLKNQVFKLKQIQLIVKNNYQNL